jgi:hypothetical protein
MLRRWDSPIRLGSPAAHPLPPRLTFPPLWSFVLWEPSRWPQRDLVNSDKTRPSTYYSIILCFGGVRGHGQDPAPTSCASEAQRQRILWCVVHWKPTNIAWIKPIFSVNNSRCHGIGLCVWCVGCVCWWNGVIGGHLTISHPSKAVATVTMVAARCGCTSAMCHMPDLGGWSFC